MRALILVSLLTTGSLTPFSLCAQAAPPSPDKSATVATTPAEVASTPAATPQEPDSGDIVVTAQKREQTLQNVSSSISALGGEALQDAGIASVEDLQVAIPNITIGDSFGFANLFIRGLGLNSTFANVDPSVTLYEDGSIISQPAAQLFSFFDLERVEVLRGPQGTLYGRNATGGTINLITAKPTRILSGFARVEAGNYSLFETEGAISGPLTDTVAARFAYFVTNRGGLGTNIVTGRKISDTRKQAVRGQLLFEPSSSFNFLLTGEYGHEDDRTNALLFKRETFPGVLQDSNPANDFLAAPGRGGFPTGDERDYASDVDPSNVRSTWSITGRAELEISDALSLTSITNYRQFKSDQTQDLDLSSVRNSTVQQFLFDSKHFSQELQANINVGGLDLVTGAYYFTEDLYHLNAIGIGPRFGEFNQSAPGNGRRVFLFGNGDTDTFALFWNARYALGETLTLKGGGRFTRDQRKVDNENYIFTGNPARQIYIPGPDGRRVFKDYTNEAGLEWRPYDRIMLYYTYSEGFKAGTGQLGTNVGSIIDPETIRNHEVGLKSALGRLTFNVSAYAYKIKGLQLDQTLPGGASGFTTQFRNATSQKSHGIEMDATWRPSRTFRTALSVAVQHTEFGSFLSIDPTNPAQRPENILGNRARNAPKVSGSLRSEYDVPLSSGAAVHFGGDVSFKSRQYFSEFNDRLLSQAAYAVLDARVSYTPSNLPGKLALWVKNITDQDAEAANFAVATGRVVGRTLIDPRTYGATLSYRF